MQLLFHCHMTANLISAGSAKTLFNRGGNTNQLLIAQSLGNARAKILKSEIIIQVTAKMSG